MIRVKYHVPTYLGHRDLDLHGPKESFATVLDVSQTGRNGQGT